MNGECRIIVYKNCKIQPNKNFKVDNLSSYLATLQVANRVVSNRIFPYVSQWMKHALKHTYKMTLTQSYHNYQDQDITSVFANDLNYNYLEAVNYDKPYNSDDKVATSKVYYFIKAKRWKSEDCVELDLEMDVINTLIDNGSGLELTDKTMILRQHKDRWKNGLSPEMSLPVIDLYSEGINPVLFKNAEANLYELTDDNDVITGSFYLIYRSQQLDNDTGEAKGQIDILLCADEEIPVNVSSIGGYYGELSWKDLDNNSYDMIIYADDSPQNIATEVSFKVIKDNGQKETKTLKITALNQAIFLSQKECAIGLVSASGFTPQTTYKYTGWTNKRFENFSFKNLMKVREVSPSATYSDLTSTYITSLNSTDKIDNYIGLSGTIHSIGEIDRTDPRLLKIIKLPYRPVDFNIDSNGVLTSLPSGWELATNLPNSFPPMLRYTSTDTTKALSRFMSFYSDNTDYQTPFDILRASNLTAVKGNLIPKSSEYETKLHNSEFYLQKFVYDSFTFSIRAELLEGDDPPFNLQGKYAVSLAMSSKFMFQLIPFRVFDEEEWTTRYGDFKLKYDISDYSGLVYVVRNNELPIFNSAYMNYIRTGYNFDVKTRNRQLAQNIIGGTLSIAGAVVSAVAGGPIGATGAVGLGISGASFFTKAVMNTAQNDQNIAQRLKEAEMQGVNIAGADDVDLLSEYAYDNKARLIKYQVSPKMEEALFDLFHYCGYVAGFQGLPDTTSRMWFNFVQAQPVFTNMQNFPNEWIEELFNKYNQGITFLHRQGWENAYLWDFEQANENWETSLRKQRVQTATATSVVKDREYILDPSAEMDYTARIMIAGKCTFRIRQKSNMMVVKEITGCDGMAVRFAFSETIQVVKNLAVIEEIPIEDYNQDNFYWSFEFSEAIATPTTQQQQLLDYCLGYVID